MIERWLHLENWECVIWSQNFGIKNASESWQDISSWNTGCIQMYSMHSNNKINDKYLWVPCWGWLHQAHAWELVQWTVATCHVARRHGHGSMPWILGPQFLCGPTDPSEICEINVKSINSYIPHWPSMAAIQGPDVPSTAAGSVSPHGGILAKDQDLSYLFIAGW